MKKNIIKIPNEFRDWMAVLKDVWAFDCETTSLNYLDLEMIGFSICDGTRACYVPTPSIYKKELLMILDYYLHEAKMVIMHNSPFDMMCLKKEGIEI